MPIVRINTIRQIGRFKNFSGGGVIALSNISDGKNMTAILGDNTYGKSTLADIFRSASYDGNLEIAKRRTIPRDSTLSQAVALTYQRSADDRQENITFNGNGWTNNKLKDKVLVFDQEFIHQNIFTGIDLTRDNKVNFTDFILGEEGVKLGAEIEGRNVEARKFPETLRQMRPGHVKNEYDVKRVDAFIKLNVIEDKATLEKEVAVQQKTLERLDRAADFAKLPNVEVDEGSYAESIDQFTDLLEKVRDASYDDVSKEALEQIQEQLDHTEEHWLEQGTKMLDGDTCPYCTQNTSSVKTLIDAYRAVFDRKYDIYIARVNKDIDTMSDAFSALRATVLSSQLNKSIEVTRKYQPFIGELDELADELGSELKKLQEAEASIRRYIADTLQEALDDFVSSKKVSIHKRNAESVPTEGLKELVIAADNEALKLRNTLAKVTEIVRSKREETSRWTSEVIVCNKMATNERILLATTKIRRIEQNDQCQLYLAEQKRQKEYKTDTLALQTKLEDEQSQYLATLFGSINDWFQKLGSSDFELDKTHSKRGNKTVYELRVSFCGRPIDNDDLGKVFSESDRRNLALAIYLARAEHMDKASIILVLDDPVVSFDDNRILSTCTELKRLSMDFEQIIVLTHYKSVIRRLLKTRSNTIYLKIEKDSAGARLTSFNTDDFHLSDHEQAYLALAGFVNGDHNNPGNLRPFMEQHLNLLFQPRLRELGLTNAMLSDKITGLRDAGDIQADVKLRLDGFREALNPNHHDDPDDMSIEDRRNLTRSVLEELYKL